MEKSRSVSFLSFGRLLKARNHNFEEGNPMRKNQLVVKLGYSIGYCILHTCILKIGLAKKSVATVRTGARGSPQPHKTYPGKILAIFFSAAVVSYCAAVVIPLRRV